MRMVCGFVLGASDCPLRAVARPPPTRLQSRRWMRDGPWVKSANGVSPLFISDTEETEWAEQK